MNKLSILCNIMREMKYQYNSEYNNKIGSDKQIELKARIDLLELLLSEATFIKNSKELHEIEIVEDVGC